jgi:hypothetical protein
MKESVKSVSLEFSLFNRPVYNRYPYVMRRSCENTVLQLLQII